MLERINERLLKVFDIAINDIDFATFIYWDQLFLTEIYGLGSFNLRN
jgi:hypothetical protein